MKKILVSDYDQTLHVNEHDLKINLKFIERFRKEGNKFIIATGRPFPSIVQEIERYNIDYDYLTCVDGLESFNKSRVLKAYTLPLGTEKLLASKFKNQDLLYYRPTGKDRDKRVMQCYYIIDDKNEADDLLREIKCLFKDDENIISYMLGFGENFLVIRPKEISKATPIEYIRKLERVSAENVYTVGDQSNDIPMLQTYNGYSIEGCIEDVRNVALDVYGSVASLIDNIEKKKVKKRL